jgi:hypothetical protein
VTRGPWPAWLVAVVGSFAVLEYAAVGRGWHPSLSMYLRSVMGIHPKTRLGRVTPVAFAAFWLWVVIHLVADVVHEAAES